MEYLQTKICIVGGGPAGATASLFLSRYGIPHILVDKAKFPRDKVCGESFDGRVYRILDELSPWFLPDLQQQDLLFKTWNYCFQSKKIDLPVTFPASNLPRLALARAELDQFLLEQAEKSPIAKILQGAAIRETVRNPDGISLIGAGFQVDTQLVIMAAGARHSTDKDPSLFVFNRTYYELPGTDKGKGLEVFYFNRPVQGCLFLCPLSRGRYNVEIGVQQAAYKAGGVNMEDLLRAYICSRPELADRFAAGRPLGRARGTTMLLRSKTKWSEPGIIHIGAGAFCVNPITGLGVGNAMSMGKLAAHLVREYIDQPDWVKQVTGAYRVAARSKFRSILLLNQVVNFTHRHFGFFEPLLSTVLQLKMVHNLLIKKDLVKGRKKPAFNWKWLSTDRR